MTTAATIAADRPLLTRPFLGWLSAAAVAAVGDGVLYFAFGWVATGYGAQRGLVAEPGAVPAHPVHAGRRRPR